MTTLLRSNALLRPSIRLLTTPHPNSRALTISTLLPLQANRSHFKVRLSKPRPASPAQSNLYSTSQPPKEAPEIKRYDYEAIQALSKALEAGAGRNTVLVDVREPPELTSTGHIPGAVNLPLSTFQESLSLQQQAFETRFGFEKPKLEKEVVVYCKSGVRSKKAAGLLVEGGWERVGEYGGSWVEWSKKREGRK